MPTQTKDAYSYALQVEYRRPGTLDRLLHCVGERQEELNRLLRETDEDKTIYLLEIFGSVTLSALLDDEDRP